MKTAVKRISAAALSAVVLCLSSACAEKKDSGGETQPEEYVYKGTSAEISGEINGDFENFGYYNGKVYFFSEISSGEENERSAYYLNIADTDGSGLRSLPVSEGENVFFSPLSFSEDGKGYYAETRLTADGYSYALKEIGENGEETGRADITKAAADNAPDIFPSVISVCGDTVYIGDYSDILAFKTDGKFAGAVGGIQGLQSIAADKNGKAYALIWSGAGYELCGIDPSAGTLEESAALPIEGYSSSVSVISGKDSGFDLFISDGTALFGWDIGGEKTELFVFTAAGISIMEVSDIFYSGNETFVCAGRSFPYKAPKVSVLAKQLSGNSGKTELILAGGEYSVDAMIENRVVKFNASNDKYFITVKKYPLDDTDRLGLDIISGNVPDILISNSYLSAEKYIRKGIFADMYGLIDSDPDISRGDFEEHIMLACETDGKLYRFTDKFKVYTVIGKTSVFGEKMGLTFERLNSIAASYPAGTEVFPACSKSDILSYAMEISGGEFVDKENKKCSFDSDRFIRLLEYAGAYIGVQDGEAYFDGDLWDRLDTMYADGSALLMIIYLSDYSDIYRFERTNFGEKVTAVGFPSENGGGTSFVIDSGFSISERSKGKEGAWEFVKTLLSPEHQDACECFPVRKSSLEKAAKAAMEHDPYRKNYAVAMMGQMAFSFGVAGIGEPGQEDIDKVNEVISSAKGLMSYDQNIMSIILEEAEAFFSSSKSAEETAKLIQTRVQLYIDEQG